ncbi:MAG: helix-turn-helix transcriptional regulator [Chitinophagales bacterium]|jgi:DNA-binding HxlR family transcriptional regulator|nr:helix-turn-helix transcriptional regulator [Chitinophagales bacterium]
MEIKDKQQGIKIVADVLDIVGGKWRGKILAHLCDSPKRFNELKSKLSKITSSTLTKELRYLEDIKILERKIVSQSPNIVEYHLTTHGKSIKELIQTIIEWGIKHREIVFENKLRSNQKE